MNNKFKNVLTFGGFIILILICAFIFPKASKGVKLEQNTEEISIREDGADLISSDLKTEFDEQTKDNEKKIFVYIVGAVNNPGVLEVAENSRLYEVINLASGETKDADLSLLNLASTVYDSQKIIVPFKDENQKTYKESINTTFKNENVEQNNSSSGLININTATVSILTKLNGIGESTAKKIITYREENGNFKSIEEIKNVNGIGDSKYNAIKNDITI